MISSLPKLEAAAFDPEHHVHVFDLESRVELREFDAGKTAVSALIAITPDSKLAMIRGGVPDFVLWSTLPACRGHGSLGKIPIASRWLFPGMED